jgi:putative phosphoribosyl transferase
MVERFRNRADAGRVLAGLLSQYANRDDVLVLALPRGGVPVGYVIAGALDVPLDVFLVRKLGVPGHQELAMGAIATGNVLVLNEEVIRTLGITPDLVDTVATEEQRELQRRERAYRDDRPPPNVQGRVVILVDDGLATGATMLAAATAVRSLQPSRLVVAVPVASPETCNEFRAKVDEIICAKTPEPFYAVGFWYEDFEQITDDEVRELLTLATRTHPSTTGTS